MAETHVVSALVAKRAELSGIIQRIERQLAGHRDSLAHLDATILLFDPDAKPSGIKPKTTRQRNTWFRQNECIRAIYDVLRSAPEPMTTRAIAERIIAAKGIPDEGRAHELIAKTVLGSLNRAKDVERSVSGGAVVWRVRVKCYGGDGGDGGIDLALQKVL
jgi:hypothetical protein